MQITKFIIRFLIWNEKANFIKTLLIFQFWLLTEKRKTKTKFFLDLFWLKTNFKKPKSKFLFIFWFQIFIHFLILVVKMKNEKFSKFVLFLNQKTNYTFGTRIFYVACLNFRNENQNFLSNFLFQFIKNSEMAL